MLLLGLALALKSSPHKNKLEGMYLEELRYYDHSKKKQEKGIEILHLQVQRTWLKHGCTIAHWWHIGGLIHRKIPYELYGLFSVRNNFPQVGGYVYSNKWCTLLLQAIWLWGRGDLWALHFVSKQSTIKSFMLEAHVLRENILFRAHMLHIALIDTWRYKKISRAKSDNREGKDHQLHL